MNPPPDDRPVGWGTLIRTGMRMPPMWTRLFALPLAALLAFFAWENHGPIAGVLASLLFAATAIPFTVAPGRLVDRVDAHPRVGFLLSILLLTAALAAAWADTSPIDLAGLAVALTLGGTFVIWVQGPR
jgi:hypothetical protein